MGPIIASRMDASKPGIPATPGPSGDTPSSGGGDSLLEDAELVTRSLKGEAEAFAGLVRRYEARVFALSAAGLGGPARRADVDDCAQEVFLAAYRGLGGLRSPGAFGPWLMGIAQRQVLQSLRKRGRNRMAPLPEGLTAPEIGAGDGDALAALAELPENERRAVALRHLAGETPRDIARLLEIPEGTARSWISRGLARLREKAGRGEAS